MVKQRNEVRILIVEGLVVGGCASPSCKHFLVIAVVLGKVGNQNAGKCLVSVLCAGVIIRVNTRDVTIKQVTVAHKGLTGIATRFTVNIGV